MGIVSSVASRGKPQQLGRSRKSSNAKQDIRQSTFQRLHQSSDTPASIVSDSRVFQRVKGRGRESSLCLDMGTYGDTYPAPIVVCFVSFRRPRWFCHAQIMFSSIASPFGSNLAHLRAELIRYACICMYIIDSAWKCLPAESISLVDACSILFPKVPRLNAMSAQLTWTLRELQKQQHESWQTLQLWNSANELRDRWGTTCTTWNHV